MSIFDPNSGMDPDVWLREKSLATLQIAAKLIDLANEPDTTSWYRKTLLRFGSHLVSRLLPMTALFHGLGPAAVEDEEWKAVLDKGSFALAKWCAKWNVADPQELYFALAAVKRDGRADDKRKSVRKRIEYADDDEASWLKLEIHGHMAGEMLRGGLSDPARRLLAYMLFELNTSRFEDVVVLNRGFLPTDIGCSSDEVARGYRLLYEKGLIEKVEGLEISKEAIALRLVVDGVNDGKHPLPYREETFGRPGLRIGGKPAFSHIILTPMEGPRGKYLEWLSRSPEKIDLLRRFLQESVGEDKVYVESINVNDPPDKGTDAFVLEIIIRHPLDEEHDDIKNDIEALVEKWIDESKRPL